MTQDRLDELYDIWSRENPADMVKEWRGNLSQDEKSFIITLDYIYEAGIKKLYQQLSDMQGQGGVKQFALNYKISCY